MGKYLQDEAPRKSSKAYSSRPGPITREVGSPKQELVDEVLRAVSRRINHFGTGGGGVNALAADKVLIADVLNLYVANNVEAALAEIAGASSPAVANDANVLVQLTATGSVATTQHEWNSRYVSVKDFGAVGNGVADDTAAIQAAMDSGSKGIYAPSGTYLVNTINMQSNVMLFGDGTNATIFRCKNGTNDDVIDLTNKTHITFRDFRIEGNSANQSAGSGIKSGGATDLVIDNVIVDDTFDHGFSLAEITRAKLTNCQAIDMKGGINAGAVRGGFLLGSSGSVTNAIEVVLEGCSAKGTNNFFNGFMLDAGSNIRLTDCYSETSYTGFKINTNHSTLEGCESKGGTQGFQVQATIQSLILNGNRAYFAGDSGFFLNVPSGTSQDWIICNNISHDNAQVGSATSYGFAFELTVGAVLDRLVLIGNIATSQGRGFSFVNGLISNAFVGGNIAKDNTADWINSGGVLQVSTLTLGPNVGFNGNASELVFPSVSKHLQFWIDNVAASAGAASISDGVGERGYVMAKPGYLRGIYVKSNAAVTAGTITFVVRKNGVDLGSGINITSGTFNIVEETPMANVFAAGDLIQCRYSSSAGLLPDGSNDFSVAVEVCYA